MINKNQIISKKPHKPNHPESFSHFLTRGSEEVEGFCCVLLCRGLTETFKFSILPKIAHCVESVLRCRMEFLTSG